MISEELWLRFEAVVAETLRRGAPCFGKDEPLFEPSAEVVAGHAGDFAFLTRVEGLGHSKNVCWHGRKILDWYLDKAHYWEASLNPLSDREVMNIMLHFGYKPERWETVLVRPTADPPPVEADVRVCRPEELDLWAETVAMGYRSKRLQFRPFADIPGATAFLAFVEDEPAGGGMLLDLGDDVRLIAGAVKEPFRGRGLQRALLAARLCYAGAGRVAFIEAEPFSTSWENQQRCGFTALGDRMILIRRNDDLPWREGDLD